MYKCEIYETTVPGKGTMYGIKCGKVKKLVSDNLENVKRISDKCNEYGGIDPIHLSDIIEDELWQGWYHLQKYIINNYFKAQADIKIYVRLYFK